MVKGVNRSIIEISETESQVFERAILFVRPGSQGRQPEQLEEQARRYLGSVGLRVRMLRGPRRGWIFLSYLATAALGALAACLWMGL